MRSKEKAFVQKHLLTSVIPTNFMRLKEKASIDQQLPHYSSESNKNESFSFFPSPNRRMDMF